MRQLELWSARGVPRRLARVPEDATRSATRRGSTSCASSMRAHPKISPRGAARGSKNGDVRSSRPICASDGADESRADADPRPIRSQRGLVWPQRLRVALGYPRWRSRAAGLPSTARRRRSSVPSGLPRPLFVLPNGAGLGYGLFMLDEGSRKYLLEHLEEIPDRADARQRLGHAVGEHASSHRSASASFSTWRCARCRGRPTSRTCSGCSATRRARSGACSPPAERAAAWTGARGDAACRDRQRRDQQREVGMVLRIPGRCHHAGRRGMARACVAARVRRFPG